MDQDKRKLRQTEWLKTHTLTKDQFKQLIQDKIQRAAHYQTASHIKREVLKSAI